MIRYGARPEQMSATNKTDIFYGRLNLLLIMAKAFQKNYPLGRFRRKAIVDNAQFIFYESLVRIADLQNDQGRQTTPREGDEDLHEHHIWLQRVQLLAIMMKSAAEGNPLGEYRRRAFNKNIDRVSRYLSVAADPAHMSFLKVA